MRLNDDAQRAFSVQDYGAPPAIQGVEIVDLKRFSDDGGSFIELGRLGKGGVHAAFPGFECRQINYSEMDPGVIKAFHIHRRQTDVWFVPPGDKMLLVLVDVRAGSATEKVGASSISWTRTSSRLPTPATRGGCPGTMRVRMSGTSRKASAGPYGFANPTQPSPRCGAAQLEVPRSRSPPTLNVQPRTPRAGGSLGRGGSS